MITSQRAVNNTIAALILSVVIETNICSKIRAIHRIYDM